MTKRALMLALCAAVLLVCALSTRGALFWLLFWVLCMMLISSLIAAIWARATLSLSSGLDNAQVTRGARVVLGINIVHRCSFPIASLRLDLCAMNDSGTFSLEAPVKPFIVNALTYALHCPHVGTYPSGVAGVGVRDVFGLFSLYKRFSAEQEELVVLPKVYITQPLTFSPGESDNESVTARAFEDATMPTDLRAFQQGDELKKVHWKLSMRRKELLVRVYDQPQRPDALLLIDCAPPDAPPEGQAVLRDAICEAAASVASAALDMGAPIRMPLLTENPTEISTARQEDIGMILDGLARCAFDGNQQFERVLQLETRRMRRTGTTAIITSRMNPILADIILRIRRMGPKVRVLLAADGEEETIAMLTTRLMRNDVEVEIIEIP